MAKLKMKYGIDLGTTNSAICKMENGEPIIKKSDIQKDILPSCVSFTRKKQIHVGDTGYNDLRQDRSRATKTWNEETNVMIEFKREMGLDTPHEVKNMGRSYSSEELSAEVLKTLKSFVSDDTIEAAVITIPAKFKAPEIAATMRAAKLSGIEHCSLLQEPIAASMAYGLSTDNRDGYWLVFDFGGGTFDAALLHVEDGIMTVKDTEGDNYLGGKDLDYAIVDKIIIPYLQENYVIDEIMADDVRRKILRDAVKYYAEQAKNQLSFKESVDVMSQIDEFGEDDEGVPLEIDLVVTSSQMKQVLSPIFQKAVDIVKNLLQRNNLKGTDLASLILVGGPTFSPVLRQMLKEQITPNVDTSIDPMTAVARGAALYATTQEYEIGNGTSSSLSQQVVLDVEYEPTSVQSMEYVIVKLLPNESKSIDSKNLLFEVTSADGSWSNGKIALTAKGDVAECPLKEGRANAFTITVFDEMGNRIPCSPNELTIIQGTQVGSATLPYHVGIEVRDEVMARNVFVPLKGLEKNQSLPAVGVRNGLHVPKQLNPGNPNDRMVIPIYQGEYNAEGSSAIYNDHVFDVVITGDDVPDTVAAGSEVDITLRVNNSQGYSMEVLFVKLGETVEKEIEIGTRSAISKNDWEKQFSEANRKLSSLQRNNHVTKAELDEAEKILKDLDARKANEGHDDDSRQHLLDDLRRAMRKLEDVDKKHGLDTAVAELMDLYDRLIKANNDFGNHYDNEVSAMKSEVDAAVRSNDERQVREISEEVRSLLYGRVAIQRVLVGFIRHYDESFGRYSWQDKTHARSLINQGISMINGNTDWEALRQVFIQIQNLLPEDEKKDDDIPRL